MFDLADFYTRCYPDTIPQGFVSLLGVILEVFSTSGNTKYSLIGVSY